MTKILIIRLSSIGDIVLASAFIRCLHKNGFLHIDFCTKSEYATIFDAHPYINQVLSFENNYLSLAKSIRKEKYDYIFDIHNKLNTNILNLLISSNNISYWKNPSIKNLLYVLTKNKKYLPLAHRAIQYFEAAKKLSIDYDNQGLDFFIDNKSVAIQLLPKQPYNVLVLGATHFTKRLPLEKLKELLQKDKKTTLLIGGNDVIETSKILETSFSHVINYVGKTNIHTSAYLMQNAETVFTNDTGMMHIAAALDCNIVSFWGGTSPALGFYPLHRNATKSKIIQNENLNCRPCSKYGKNKCPKSHFNCMYDLEI